MNAQEIINDSNEELSQKEKTDLNLSIILRKKEIIKSNKPINRRSKIIPKDVIIDRKVYKTQKMRYKKRPHILTRIKEDFIKELKPNEDKK